jgi:hypothetical protein
LKVAGRNADIQLRPEDGLQKFQRHEARPMSSISALNSLLGSNYSSAIDLSSILQAAMGASSSGIDVTSAVNAAVTAAEAPEQAWESQEALLQSQSSALTTMQAGASSLDARWPRVP